jgi:hypothetical protein
VASSRLALAVIIGPWAITTGMVAVGGIVVVVARDVTVAAIVRRSDT